MPSRWVCARMWLGPHLPLLSWVSEDPPTQSREAQRRPMSLLSGSLNHTPQEQTVQEESRHCQAGPGNQPAHLPGRAHPLHSTQHLGAMSQAVSVPQVRGRSLSRKEAVKASLTAATSSLSPSLGSGWEGPRAGEGSSVVGSLWGHLTASCHPPATFGMTGAEMTGSSPSH